MVCSERNETIYTWKPTPGQAAKYPHITIGTKIEDRTVADRLVSEGCIFIFDQVDYKKVDPHDPHVSKSLIAEATPSVDNTSGSNEFKVSPQ